MGDVGGARLISIFRECRQKKNLSYAKRLHAYMCQHLLDTHTILGNHLVPLLVDCGSLADARQVFDKLPLPNEHSWSSLISGYVDIGNPDYAFTLYHRMRDDRICPSPFTFVALLRACASLRDAEKGHGFHAEIITQGLEGNPFLGNALVDMYSKCGVLAEAQDVFDKLPLRDAVTWNALLTGYAEHGLCEEAFSLFEQMQQVGTSLNSVIGTDCNSIEAKCQSSYTYVALLKACARFKDTKAGQGFHMEVMKRGLEKDLLIGSTLVDVYGTCGLLLEAHQVFDEIPKRDAVLWNTLITGYTEHGFGENALKCLKQMELEGVPPVAVTFTCSLKACSLLRTLEAGRGIHAEITKRGLERELHVGTTLVDMYAKCGSLLEAQPLFNQISVRNTVSWTALLADYVEHAFFHEALDCLEKMQLENLCPDINALTCSLKACGNIGSTERGQKLHAELTSRGLERDILVGTAILEMYINCGSLTEARRVFDWLPDQDVVVWDLLMSGLIEHGQDEQVLDYFRHMQLRGVCADAVTFLTCLKACGNIGALEMGQEIHTEIRKAGLDTDLYLGNMLVDLYGKCGALLDGQKVFESLCVRDVVSWNAMIRGYGENHRGKLAIQCFEDMRRDGIKPDSITFTSLLAACGHASLVIEGQEYFRSMRDNYGIKPTIEHYLCMVDLLARSGHIYEAERFAESIQCLSCEEIMKVLLTACKTHGEVELGLKCFKQLVQVSRDDAAAYSLLADVYASNHCWRDASKIEEMRNDAGENKKPASAFIEVKGRLYRFLVGHHANLGMSTVIDHLNACTKIEGLVPNPDFVHVCSEKRAIATF